MNMQLLGKHERSDEELAGWRALAEAGRNRKASPAPATGNADRPVETRLDEDRAATQRARREAAR